MPSGCSSVCVCVRSAFCVRVCVCARRPADSGTSAECLPFPQSFDVTRSCCDNEPCAPPQGEHPAVRPGLCQSSGPTPTTPPPHTHAHTRAHSMQTQQWRSRPPLRADQLPHSAWIVWAPWNPFMWHRNTYTPVLICTVTTLAPGNMAEYGDQYHEFSKITIYYNIYNHIGK